ncbi:MAG: MgtC/SapB family protein [Firmicutes bacterium]|nr:MgtC/SapB family protein [Bacillota bacterium]
MLSTLSIDAILNPGISWVEIGIRSLAAIIVGGAIGIEREYKNRPAGMRTHILVCLGAAMIAILECLILANSDILDSAGKVSFTFTRLSAQVISGIGFLGAGTIFIAQKKIAGLTTAASLWNVACLGLMCGFGYYWIALLCSVLVVTILTFFQKIIRVNSVKRVEVRFINRIPTLEYINSYFVDENIKILDVDFHVELFRDSNKMEMNSYTNLYTLHLPSKVSYTDIVKYLSENENIQTVRTRNT